jgi:Holliday junction resolvase
MLESEIQRQIIEYLQLKGFLVFRMNAGTVRKGNHHIRLAPAGTPDLLCIRHGYQVWLEIKTSDGKTSAEQDDMHAVLNMHLQKVYTVRSVEEVEKIIPRIRRR